MPFMVRILPILITCLSASAFAQRGKKPSYLTDDRRPEVIVEVIEHQQIFEPKVFGGFLESEQSRPASPEVAGTIDKFLVRPGEATKFGQILFLVKPKGSDTEFQYHKVRSPLTGVVSTQLRDIGEFVQPGDPVVQVADPSRLTIRFDAALQDVIHLRPGMKGDVSIAEPGLPHLTVQGTISAVSPASHPELRTYQIYMRLNCAGDCPELFRIGAFARVTMKENVREGILIKSDYLKNDGKSAFIVTKTNHLKEVTVTTGYTDGEFIEILTGLEPGMHLVTSYSGKLRDGREVTVKEIDVERQRLLNDSSPPLNEH